MTTNVFGAQILRHSAFLVRYSMFRRNRRILSKNCRITRVNSRFVILHSVFADRIPSCRSLIRDLKFMIELYILPMAGYFSLQRQEIAGQRRRATYHSFLTASAGSTAAALSDGYQLAARHKNIVVPITKTISHGLMEIG